MSENRPTFRRVALVVHPHRPKARELASAVERWWESRGVSVMTEDAESGPRPEAFSGEIDLAMSLGGDGTMLKTVALTAPIGTPVLGVNLGNLGYLTSIEPDEVVDACVRLVNGDFDVENRMVLDITITRKLGAATEVQHVVGVNEVVVEKTSDGHTIYLGVKIGEDPFLTFAADGLLVATPTGSTAYNLSLHGPIVSPRIRALIVTPIAPHMLFDRTLVVEPELCVCFEILPDREAVAVVDGERVAKLSPGDLVEVRASKHVARLIKIGDRTFYRILHTKFGLLDR